MCFRYEWSVVGWSAVWLSGVEWNLMGWSRFEGGARWFGMERSGNSTGV